MSKVGCSGWEDMVVDVVELEESRRCCATSDAGEVLEETAAIYAELPPAMCWEIRDSRLAGRGGMILRLLRGRDRYIGIYVRSSSCARQLVLVVGVVHCPIRKTPPMKNAGSRLSTLWGFGFAPVLFYLLNSVNTDQQVDT